MARKETMSSRERWLAVLNGQKPDRLPTYYRATGEFTDKLLKHTGLSDMRAFCEKYHVDQQVGLGPRYVGPPIPEDEDIFGCKYIDIDYGTGTYRECNVHPLAGYETVEEIEANYTWPSVDHLDFSGIAQRARDNAHMPLTAGGWEPFLQYKYLRGEVESNMDLILNPDICHYIMGKLFEYFYARTERTLAEAGGLVIYSTSSEDLGSQTSLLYSPKHIREFFLPYHKKMIAMQHAAGAKVMWHSDGAVRAILPDLIEIGVDMLDPVQWRCPGMEREGLKNDFGDKLSFHAGVDNQFTLPFGSVEDVRQEVLENFATLGRGGGYVLGPCHNFQPVGPAENAVAMYEACYEECWY